ncbi:MAG: hypothetical protein R3C68_19270 [Myxococcota bacterium]
MKIAPHCIIVSALMTTAPAMGQVSPATETPVNAAATSTDEHQTAPPQANPMTETGEDSVVAEDLPLEVPQETPTVPKTPVPLQPNHDIRPHVAAEVEPALAEPAPPAVPREIPAETLPGWVSSLVPYGFIRLDTIWDSSRFQDAGPRSSQFAMWVSPEPAGPGRNDGRLNIHPRLTRLGLKTNPLALSEHVKISGKVEVDFQGGGSESRQFIRLRHAYLELAAGPVTLLAGQTWDLVSPLFPAANNDGMMWNAGNTGDRRPQMRLTYEHRRERYAISLAAAALMTGAVDGKDSDADGEPDGFDASSPTVQARLGGEIKLWANEPVKLGVWGHYAREEISVGSDVASSMVGFDASIPIIDAIALEGEGWMGQNLSDVRGGIGQGINSLGQEIDASGGWIQLKLVPCQKLQLFGGITLDNPNDADVDAGGRRHNQALYTVVRYRPWQSFQVAAEYLHWRTQYADAADATPTVEGRANRIDFHLSYFL